MARQFLIGELGNASSAYTSGKLADTALEIEVLNASDDEGPILYNASTMANPDMFRIVQGTTSGPNVYSNWINPKNVIVFDGSSAETSTHHEIDLAIAGVAVAGTNMTLEIKFVYHNPNGVDEFFSFDTTITAVSAANSDAVIQTAYEAATKPDWLHNQASLSGDVATAATGAATPSTPSDATITFLGNVPGATTTDSGDAFAGPDAAIITGIVVATNDIGTQTYTFTNNAVRGDNGVGTYYSTKKFEDKMKGIMYGFYDRMQFPNTPDNGAVSGSTYDFVTIVATKDGSAMSGQIHGVDNLDEVFIAGKAGVATIYTADDLTSFVEKLNTLLPLTSITV
jgi:hypothetical protein